MLKIRLTRTGKRNDPRFRIVVAEHTKPVKGKFVSIVGHYDPIHKKIVTKKEEITSWLKKGAKPSNRVAKLLKKEGIKHPLIVVKKFHKKPKVTKKASQEPKESKGLAKQQNQDIAKTTLENNQAKEKNIKKDSMETKDKNGSEESKDLDWSKKVKEIPKKDLKESKRLENKKNKIKDSTNTEKK